MLACLCSWNLIAFTSDISTILARQPWTPQIQRALSMDIDIIDETGVLSPLPLASRVCLPCQYLSVGRDVSRRPALIPSGVHQTPVPRSSDRRSYYFLIALVACVPWDRPHHVTDSTVNTASPGVTEWELTAVTPLSRLFSLLPPLLFRLLISGRLIAVTRPTLNPPHITFTWRPGSEVTCVGVRLFLTLLHPSAADQEATTPNSLILLSSITFGQTSFSPCDIFNIFRRTLLAPLMQYHNNIAGIAGAGQLPLCVCQ